MGWAAAEYQALGYPGKRLAIASLGEPACVAAVAAVDVFLAEPELGHQSTRWEIRDPAVGCEAELVPCPCPVHNLSLLEGAGPSRDVVPDYSEKYGHKQRRAEPEMPCWAAGGRLPDPETELVAAGLGLRLH